MSFNISQTMKSDGAMALFQRLENNRNPIDGTYTEMETVKLTALLKTVCLMGLLFILIKKNVGHILQREWAPDYGRLLKITQRYVLLVKFLLTPPTPQGR